MRIPPLLIPAVLLVAGGCGIGETESERVAKEQSASVGAQFRPADAKPPLPDLKKGAPFSDYLAYAYLNSPEVEAAYYDWAASVQTITVARSLPDPRLTFQMDIQRGFIPSVMPGIQFDIPGPGKLTAAANIAAATSDVKYQLLAGQVLNAALNLERSCWEIQFLDAKLKSLRSSLALLNESEEQASALNATGRTTIQDVLRAQIEQERLKTEIKNLEESREPLLEKFKAALGLSPKQTMPPLPVSIPDFPQSVDFPQKIFDEGLKNNPGLKALEAEIRKAESSLSMARKAQIPDFSLGGELDALAIPVLIRPMASMTLPIWRDKIAAGIAAAQADKRSAEAKWTSAQIALAVQCAEKLYLTKEAARNLETLRQKLLPKAQQTLDAAKLAYASNGVDFLTLLSAERTLLAFDVEEAAARLQLNTATAELALAIAGRMPSEAEFMKTKESVK